MKSDKRQHNTKCAQCGEGFNPYDPFLMHPWTEPRYYNLDGYCSRGCYEWAAHVQYVTSLEG